MNTDRLRAFALILMAGLVALLILSVRSCSVDKHHQDTEQSRICTAQGGTWTPGGYSYSGTCEYKK